MLRVWILVSIWWIRSDDHDHHLIRIQLAQPWCCGEKDANKRLVNFHEVRIRWKEPKDHIQPTPQAMSVLLMRWTFSVLSVTTHPFPGPKNAIDHNIDTLVGVHLRLQFVELYGNDHEYSSIWLAIAAMAPVDLTNCILRSIVDVASMFSLHFLPVASEIDRVMDA